MKTLKELEALIWEEARYDFEMENKGISPAIGAMQRDFPKEYAATRELMLSMVTTLPSLGLSIQQAKKISEMLHSEDEGFSSIQDVLNMQPVNALTLAHLIKLERSYTAKNAVNTRHDKPGGGARDKRKEIQKIWAQGKYTSRDICAEQECGQLGLSYSTARKALRNTPEPPRSRNK